jgi:outer membrane receptor protein involved in Fe transport
VQDVALTWFWNRYTIDMKNHDANATFLGAGWDTFGGCCVRNFDVQYTTTAPYASVNWDSGAFSVDASVRSDSQKANGWALQDDPVAQKWDPATQQKVDYKLSKTSYSLGGNYQINKDLAAFARSSSGVSMSADRLLYGNPLDGSVPVAVNEVKQTEGGVKWRQGSLSAFLTLFQAKTEESNYEATTQTFTANKYKASGAELEMGYRGGDLRVSSGLTLNNAKITASSDAGTVGKKPRRVADVVLQVSPSYAFGDFELGATVMHNGKSFGDDANTITMPAYTVVNGFASWQASERAQVLVSVNNLGNTIGYTEIEGDGHAARSINGRTAKVSLKYTF